MKKLSAIVLAVIMTFAMSVCAFAETTYTDPNAGKTENFVNETSAPIPFYYVEANEGSVSPAETFNFKVEPYSVAQSALHLDAFPEISDFSITFAQGEATVDGKRKVVNVSLPEASEFGTVGLYTYKISQIVPEVKNAGVTYDLKPTFLKLTVIEQDGLKVIAAVHYETETGEKIDGNDSDLTPNVGFTNIYSAAAKNPEDNDSTGFTVKKLVTGNFGDKTKVFNVKVTFSVPSGIKFSAPITVNDSGVSTEAVIAQDQTSKGYTATATITVKDNETVTFSNVPYGTSFSVAEDDYTTDAGGKYDAPKYTVDGTQGSTGTVNAPDVEIEITNNKGVPIDTGVIIDSIPYIVILGIIIAGAAILVLRRKPEIG